MVAILPIKPVKITDDPSHQPTPFKYVFPILTGSYDEALRLFIYDSTTAKNRLVTEAQLGGGVWRLKLMDEYVESIPREESNGAGCAAMEPRETNHFLVLASCMHAGVKILRITYTAQYCSLPKDTLGYEELVANMGWQIEVVAQFTAGHESMVYCCDFRTEEAELGPGSYTIVSTSFYDKQVCVWGFVDEVKRALGSKERT